MRISELLKIKSNPFDHLLYEFEMYLSTYEFVNQTTDISITVKNALIESHGIHLRNLLEFFNCQEKSFNTTTIFNCNRFFGVADPSSSTKQVINKSIGHLTKERFSWNQTEDDLTIRYNVAIHTMFPHIKERILQCVRLLISEQAVNESYVSYLHDSGIQMRLYLLERNLT